MIYNSGTGYVAIGSAASMTSTGNIGVAFTAITRPQPKHPRWVRRLGRRVVRLGFYLSR